MGFESWFIQKMYVYLFLFYLFIYSVLSKFVLLLHAHPWIVAARLMLRIV